MRLRLLLGSVGLLWGSLWAQPALNPSEDERLNQKLTVRAVGTPLRDLCLQLSQRTKVALKVEPSVQEYRACVYAKEKPLVEVMQHLAEAFGFQWQREKPSDEEPYQYRLVTPPRKTPETPPGALERFRREVLPKVCEQQRIPIEERFQRVIQYATNSFFSCRQPGAIFPIVPRQDASNLDRDRDNDRLDDEWEELNGLCPFKKDTTGEFSKGVYARIGGDQEVIAEIYAYRYLMATENNQQWQLWLWRHDWSDIGLQFGNPVERFPAFPWRYESTGRRFPRDTGLLTLMPRPNGCQ
jgi:hypothetical protein